MKFLIDRLPLTTKFMFLIFFFCAVASKAAVIKWNNTTKTKDFMEAFVHYASFLSWGKAWSKIRALNRNFKEYFFFSEKTEIK